MATKRVLESLEKMSSDMTTQKAACHKALDERERFIDQIKHLQDDSTRDAADFEAQVELLKRDSEEFDQANSHKEHVLEAATELEKRKMCAAMRNSRAEKEKLEVRYGYLRSQLEGIDNDFRELQRIVGVHFVPSHPESLQQIIETFVEKEQRVASLQKYWTLQSDEVESLTSELGSLEKLAEKLATEAEEHGVSAAAAANFSAQKTAGSDGAIAELTQSFEKLCVSLERVYVRAGCAEEPKGAHLATKGCSSSTIHDFMAALATRIDDLSHKAYTLRHVGQFSTHRSSNSGRKVPEAIDAFLQPRGGSVSPPVTDGSSSPAGAADEGAASGAAIIDGGVTKESLLAKENLPSISDIAQDADGEAEVSEGRRRTKHEPKKGAIDREKRDTTISAWVARQQMVRGAQTARPSIREFYEEDVQWPQRAVYPPASAR